MTFSDISLTLLSLEFEWGENNRLRVIYEVEIIYQQQVSTVVVSHIARDQCFSYHNRFNKINEEAVDRHRQTRTMGAKSYL